MSSSTRYSLSYDFTAFQSANPTTPLPADKVEVEFNNLETTTGEIIDNLGLIQRSDGALTNGVVSFDSLSTTVQALLGSDISPEGNWLTATAYAVLDLVNEAGSSYLCAVAHTSGTFATDYAAGKWVLWTASTSGSVTVNNSNWSGTDLAVNNGGTGVSSLTGIVKGNGASAFSAATEGTDYSAPGGTDVLVADGGTGRSSHTAYAPLCGGSTATAAQQSVASVGAAGQVLTSNGAGALPTFEDAVLDEAGANTIIANANSASAVPTGVALAANKFLARSSTGDIVAKDLTDFALTMLDDANAASVRATLGVAAAGLTVITSGSFGAVTLLDLTSIPTTYRALLLKIIEASNTVATRGLRIELSTGSGFAGNSGNSGVYTQISGTTVTTSAVGGYLWTAATQTAAQVSSLSLCIPAYQSGPVKQYQGHLDFAAAAGSPVGTTLVFGGILKDAGGAVWSTNAVDGIRITWDNVGTGVFDGGSYVLYGVN